MATITLQNQGLVIETPLTYLASNTASGVTTLTVQNITGFAVNQILIIGGLGNQGSEIVKTHASSAPSGTTITLASATLKPHAIGTPVQLIQYDQAEFSHSSTIDGSKSVLATVSVWADNLTTNYIDNANTSGYYFGRFKDTIDTTYSDYSDPIPVNGYGIYTARSIIDSALGEINKQTSDTLSDAFAFQQLDMFQTDVLKEMKRWSFMQQFDSVIGQFNVGEWEINMPDDIEDPNTNQSVYNLRIGTQGNLTWIDKEKFNEFIFNTAYSTLAIDLNPSDTTMTLTDSSDFNHLTDANTDGSGTVTIGNQSYDYSANDITTGILTLTTTITSDNAQDAGVWVFQNANFGLPNYYTIFGGKIRYWPITADEYDGSNAFLDYYTKQVRITQDSDEIMVPDPQAASYWLQWKFLKRLANGAEDSSSLAAMNNYLARREKLKSKKVLNRTFKLSPRYQNFAIQMQVDSGDPRFIRDGAFINTGLG